MINSNPSGRSPIRELMISIYKQIDMRDFTEWLAGFRSAIAGYKYYTDFDKIYRNVDNIRWSLIL